ncbi:MBL fold metallo-hydrolase, partial [Desulfovibrio sp. OttesenSCG-928-G11]|nr:MBL fold metallo-hydrolase [Desulfovibrio sp. OttesenSCG-928-G11]
MHVATFPIGPLSTNCFVIYNDSLALAVDPGGDPSEVLDFLEQKRLTLTHVLLTHLHFDHSYGVAELRERTGARILGPEKDRYMLDNEMGRGGVWGLPVVRAYDFESLEAGETSFLGTACTVLATPGHTPGGLSFYFPELKAVFCGDTLFYRSVGRSDFPGGDQAALLQSIRGQLFALPEDSIVYCGHGLQSSIGDERRNNPYASDFTETSD